MCIKEDKDFYPDIETVKTHELCSTIILISIKRKVFRKLTEAFPHKSSRGNLYVMVMYDYDSNAVLAKQIKNRQKSTIRYALLKIIRILKSIESKPKVYIMDNDCSSDLKKI